MGPIDIVIPLHAKDRPSVRRAVRGVLNHVVEAGRVFVVSNEDVGFADDRVVWVPEPSLPAFPSFEDVRTRWLEHRPETVHRAGWIYQQLLKLGAASYIDGLSPSYLAMDADVIFVRPTWLEGDARFPYSRATEYHEPYREGYRRLLGTEPPTGHSFVTHQMLFDQELLAELQHEIEDHHGLPWYWAFVEAADYDGDASISEWETYGLWMLARHPELMAMHQLRWRNVPTVPLAFGRVVLGRDNNYVAAHHYERIPRWRHTSRLARVVGYNLRARVRRHAPWLRPSVRAARRQGR